MDGTKVALALLYGITLSLAPGTSQAQGARLHVARLAFDRPQGIRAFLTYEDGEGTPIAARGAAGFNLLLDGADQGAATQMTTFEQSGEPVSVMAVMQLSMVMEPALDEVKKGL